MHHQRNRQNIQDFPRRRFDEGRNIQDFPRRRFDNQNNGQLQDFPRRRFDESGGYNSGNSRHSRFDGRNDYDRKYQHSGNDGPPTLSKKYPSGWVESTDFGDLIEKTNIVPLKTPFDTSEHTVSCKKKKKLKKKIFSSIC